MPWHRDLFTSLRADRSRLAHAVLITGAEGIGKFAFAQAVAGWLLCEQPGEDGVACGHCPSCGWSEQGSHPDLRLLEPERPEEPAEKAESTERKASAHIEIAQVRGLLDFVNLSSHRGGARAVIVHPAEALTISAANALLKCLEEPPELTYFLLVTHRSRYILPTIRSRCRHLPLPPPAAAPALEWLRGEGVRAPELALAQSGGAPLLATRFGGDYWQVRDQVLDWLAQPDFDPLAAADALRDAEPAVVVSILQKWSYDLALRQACGCVRYNPDRANALERLAQRVDSLETARFHRRMVRVQRIVRHPLNARLFLEDLLLDYAALVRGAGRQAA